VTGTFYVGFVDANGNITYPADQQSTINSKGILQGTINPDGSFTGSMTTSIDTVQGGVSESVILSGSGFSPAYLFTDGADTGEISLNEDTKANVSAGATINTQTYYDTDASATVQAAIGPYTVTAVDAHGSAVQLSANQVSAIEAPLNVDLTGVSGANGTIKWTYDIGNSSSNGGTFDFLAAGEVVTLTTPVTLTDNSGNTASTSFQLTIDGPQAGVAGIDMRDFPGLPAMGQLLSLTNVRVTGYYLTPAPSQGNALGWMGNRAALQGQGWTIEPIYVGQQSDADPALARNLSFIEDQTLSPAAQGVADANAAANLLSDEGFSKGTAV
jgi:hypothetical protein